MIYGKVKQVIISGLFVPLFIYNVFALSGRHEKPTRKPDHIGHGSFVGSKTFQLTNFDQVEIRSTGKVSFTMKSWAGQGDDIPPCVEFKVKTSAREFRIDDFIQDQWVISINDQIVRLSPGHHALIEESGAIKIADGERDFMEIQESGVTIGNTPGDSDSSRKVP